MNAESLAHPLGLGSEARLPRIALRVAASAAALLAVAVLAAQLEPRVNRRIDAIRVEGRFAHLTAAQLAAAAGIAPGDRLFKANLEDIRARVESLPWVANARVTRQWPDALALKVVEREAVARWGDDGLLDRNGTPFRPPAADIAQTLPKLSGPEARAGEVFAVYGKLAEGLADTPFALAGLSLDARGEWTAQTQGLNGKPGIALRLGEEDPVAQIALLQGAVTRSVASQLDAVAYIDLRYPNGFAVGWVNGRDIEHCATRAGAATPDKPFCGRLSASVSGGAAGSPAMAAAQAVAFRPKAGTAPGAVPVAPVTGIALKGLSVGGAR